MNIFLLLLLSCIKQPITNHVEARLVMSGNDCLAELKSHMEAAECPELAYKVLSDYDIMFRCHKLDSERTSFWDTYIFRMSPITTNYSIEDKKFIEKHNICIDDTIRIGAYFPTEDNKL